MAHRGRDNMEHDALISQYSHLNKLPREKDAILALQKIASLVKPLMRARNWQVGTLAEFYPEQQNLLGINVNRGQKICLRLRYPGDKTQFLPMEQVVDTMLHELSHNVHGPHDAKFHALWDQLRKEYEGLLSKGYTGEGFLSDGHKLGGRNLPRHEAQRIARLAAERRRTLTSGSGQKLGGRPIQAGTDIRRVIVSAIERRNTVLKGCGASSKNDEELKNLGRQATSNGFKTKADEDAANERAIAQALWELVQEDEKKEYGKDYIPPTPADPTGNGGGDVGPSKPIKEGPASSVTTANTLPIRRPSDRPLSNLFSGQSSRSIKTEPSSISASSPSLKSINKEPSTPSSSSSSRLWSSKSRGEGSSRPIPKPQTCEQTPIRPLSRLVSEQPPTKKAKTSIHKPPSSTFQPLPPPPRKTTPAEPDPIGWTCPICTLHNTINSLACDACTSERPAVITLQLAKAERARAAARQAQAPVKKSSTWTCPRCTTEMDNQWWTCSTCSTMKSTS